MNFFDAFLIELGDMFSAEKQITRALPKVIDAVESEELKEALQNHLEETRNQVNRINEILNILGQAPHEEECKAMEGILKEGEELINEIPYGTLRDVLLIGACQKVEHYEIAAYGTLYSHAKELDLDSQVLDLLDDTLDEEGAANKKLTRIAEGTFYSSGINKKATRFSR